MHDRAASVAAMQRLRKDFEADALEFPNLFYAILHGEAFKRGGVAFEQRDKTYRSFEDYVMEHVAEHQSYTEAAGYKYPRYFFVGADAIVGARRLTIRCQIANRILRDGLDLISSDPAHRELEGGRLHDHWYLMGEGLHAHEWMYWMMELGRLQDHPLLKPRTESPRLQDAVLASSRAPKDIFVPCINGGIGLHPFDNDRALPEWDYALETAQDGSFEAVTLFETPVFYASTLMVDELLKMAGKQGNEEHDPNDRQIEILIALLELKAIDKDRRVSTATAATKAAGANVDPDIYKAPVAALVDAGLLGSKMGRDGGIWLNPTGQRSAESLAKR